MSEDIFKPGTLKPGDIVAGNKKIIRLLGKGGMAEVYEAESGFHGGRVAVKILLECFARSDEFVSRLRKESTFHSVLVHPNIVRMYDADQAPNGMVYLIMELLPGKTLRQILRKHRALPWVYATHIMNQVADAITFAHSKGIWHRDLKPENLMVGTDIEPQTKGHVWVLDFGIAKYADNRNDTGKLPQMATVRYMTPEQVRELEVDGRGDIYAFGVIYYELVTGRHPFVNDAEPNTAASIMNGHLNAYVTPVRELVPECPDAIAIIIEKCLEKDREQRYQTMRDLWEDLTGFRVSMPAEHPLAQQIAINQRRAAGKRAFASDPDALRDIDAPRMTAPMPENFQAPFTPLPFAPSSAAPRSGRIPASSSPMLGEGHTVKIPSGRGEPQSALQSPPWSPPATFSEVMPGSVQPPRRPYAGPASASRNGTPMTYAVGGSADGARGQLVPSEPSATLHSASAPPPLHPSSKKKSVGHYLFGPAIGLGIAITGAAVFTAAKSGPSHPSAEPAAPAAAAATSAAPSATPVAPILSPPAVEIASASPSVARQATPPVLNSGGPVASVQKQAPASRPPPATPPNPGRSRTVPTRKAVIPIVEDEPAPRVKEVF